MLTFALISFIRNIRQLASDARQHLQQSTCGDVLWNNNFSSRLYPLQIASFLLLLFFLTFLNAEVIESLKCLRKHCVNERHEQMSLGNVIDIEQVVKLLGVKVTVSGIAHLLGMESFFMKVIDTVQVVKLLCIKEADRDNTVIRDGKLYNNQPRTTSLQELPEIYGFISSENVVVITVHSRGCGRTK